MEYLPFYIVDVFGIRKFSGNQLAVVRKAEFLSTEQMQEIAREINFSETAFIMSDEMRSWGYDVRIFTPKRELEFAGHPSLGTAYVVQREIIKKPISNILLNLKIGKIPIVITYSEGVPSDVWMSQPFAKFSTAHNAKSVARMIGVSEDDVDDRFPVREVSTGFPYIMIPLRSLDALRRCKVDKEFYFEYIEHTEAKAIAVFCRETRAFEHDISLRVFGDYYGIEEDPATGSASGCVGAYCARYGYLDSEAVNMTVDIIIEQGNEVGRPSLIKVRASYKEDKLSIHVGGMVYFVLSGELEL